MPLAATDRLDHPAAADTIRRVTAAPASPPAESLPAERVVRVALPGHAYDVTVRHGLLAAAGAAVRAAVPGAVKAVVIHDLNVPAAAVEGLVGSLRSSGLEPLAVPYPASEANKSWDWAGRLLDPILRARVDRRTPVVALGGGVTGDVAGFVAATLLRGVPFVQVPTSLLAMVDASVGGKTGVNHPAGKNLVGAFHQPVAVLIDPAVLGTLPDRELRGGLAECVKHDLIRDAAGFERFERDVGRALALDLDYLAELVAHNVAIKARVVEADPFERGERAHLNFGHTFGHAIETVSDYGYSHGESVALGMVAAVGVSARLGLLDEPGRRRVLAAIAAAGLPTGGLSLDVDAVVAAMAFDKKVAAGRLRFVLLDGIGKAVVRDDVPADLVRAAVEGLR
ncbi:MAG: aroB [Phycisphaerales bacterium]|nr:aroB [Phycisphaerales bacterium]